MTNPTWRYHREIAPTGQIFDADSVDGLPSAEEGWCRSPYFDRVKREKVLEKPVVSWPEPAPYATVHVFMGTIEERMPKVPTDESLRANGATDAEEIEKTIDFAREELKEAASSALHYYAVGKHKVELDKRFGPERLMRECEALDRK